MLDELLAEASRGLLAMLVANPDAVRPVQTRTITLAAAEPAYLLFDWLKELLFRFEAEHLLFSRFEVQVTEGGLKANVWGEPIDWERHVLSHEVKAITYHGLKVEQTPDGWLAEVIVDI